MIDVGLVAIMISTLSPTIDANLRDRYAGDIVAAVADADEPVELAAALVATAKAEGEFSERIERCQYKGSEADNGRALGLWQIHRQWWGKFSRSDICTSNAVSASLAARALIELHRRCHSWHSTFRAFVGVNTETDPRLRGRGHNFDRLVANARRSS